MKESAVAAASEMDEDIDKRFEDVFKPEDDSPVDLANESDDSVYDLSNQEVDTTLHPLLRSYKLTKRIRKDRKLTSESRKKLQTRRNIINFRIRKDSRKSDATLIKKEIPLIQRQVSV